MNVYRRDVRNYADDDQLLNTGVSYPIAFDKSVIYGAEGKISLIRLGNLSGYWVIPTWSAMRGFRLPEDSFCGDDAGDAVSEYKGPFS